MMVTIENGKMNRAELELEIAMLKSLVGDLERILQGDYPEERKLNNCPMITNWQMSNRTAICLEGVLIEHPRLGSMAQMGSHRNFGYWILTETMRECSAVFIVRVKKHQHRSKSGDGWCDHQ